MYGELEQHVPDMGFDSFHRHPQVGRDLRIGIAEADQGQNLLLPGCQTLPISHEHPMREMKNKPGWRHSILDFLLQPVFLLS
jgi:hypothetical protein